MSSITNLIRPVIITGNILFVLWILYNGISEGFAGTMVEKFSYIALMGLLTCNALLLSMKKKS